MVVVLTVFVWGNQRHAQAAETTLAQQIICWVEQEIGDQVPFNPNIDYCGDSEEPLPTPDEEYPECFNEEDDDLDGLFDWPEDPGCSTPTDPSEDSDDPQETCEANGGWWNTSEESCEEIPQCDTEAGEVYNPSTNQCDAPTGGEEDEPQCDDGLDNDQDGWWDMEDPGCTDLLDDDEANTDQGGGNGGSNDPACQDGIDNDNDGQVDFPNDDGCSSADDDDEIKHTSGGSGGKRRSSNSNQGVVLGAESCSEYVNQYLRVGANNDTEQVARLQQVLRDSEGMDVDVTGTFDAATLAAVHAFQTKYAADVLTPWGLPSSTGYVYYTTRKKVNEVYCKYTAQFPLTDAQLAEINQYKQTKVATVVPKPVVAKPVAVAPKAEVASEVELGTQQGAAAVIASSTIPKDPRQRGNAWTRFWGWVVGE